jgi:hypothetical protein
LSKVQDLIDPTTDKWDEVFIRDNFRLGDVERILQIPLPNFGQPDFVAWHFNKSVCFSVKSAYHIEWKAEYRRRAQRRDGSDQASPHEVWKLIWKTPVSRKIQIFAGVHCMVSSHVYVHWRICILGIQLTVQFV